MVSFSVGWRFMHEKFICMYKNQIITFIHRSSQIYRILYALNYTHRAHSIQHTSQITNFVSTLSELANYTTCNTIYKVFAKRFQTKQRRTVNLDTRHPLKIIIRTQISIWKAFAYFRGGIKTLLLRTSTAVAAVANGKR